MKRMPDSVEWVGPVSGGDKDAFYRSLDVFVFPSEYRFEAQPLVVLEALSYGVPCLVTDQGYMGELVQKTGIPAIGSLSFVNCAATKITELYFSPSSFVQASHDAYSAFKSYKDGAKTALESLVGMMVRKR